jgi:dGTPase
VYAAFLEVKNFNYEEIYTSPALAAYHQYFERILETLYTYLHELFDRYGTDQGAYDSERNTLAARFGDYVCKMRPFYESEAGSPSQVVFDYIAGMTDDYAIDSIQEIMIPSQFSVQFDKLALGLGAGE